MLYIVHFVSYNVLYYYITIWIRAINRGVLFLGVLLIRVLLLFGVHIRAPDFQKLPSIQGFCFAPLLNSGGVCSMCCAPVSYRVFDWYSLGSSLRVRNWGPMGLDYGI